MDGEEKPLITDELPVMERGHLERPVGDGWDQGFDYNRQSFAQEVRLRKRFRGWANWN